MADTHAKGHDYHLVDPSPWPALGALGALILASGFIWSMHGGPPWVAVIGFLMVLYTMFVWWRDVIREARDEGHHTPVVRLHLRFGMIMFIASEVMFFMAWFWAFFNAAIYPTAQMGGVWPPEGIHTFDPWHLPLLNTLILLTSSTTVTWAHHAVREGNQKSAVQGLTVTVLLGAIFTCVQAYEYAHATFAFTGGIYGSTFFMATGFHGLHVLIGTIFLLVCLIRTARGDFTPDHHFGLEAAAWYWHFVDVVWLFLFFFIYVWGAGTVAAH
ncbi:MAG: cytochrome c oxidase subunit 3 [Proteobacteria bacterium]|nr:cytochrome c oxidase subunit 3 [Pseudomonadota bacterium]